MKNWKDILLIVNTVLLLGVLTQNFFIMNSGGPDPSRKKRERPKPRPVNVNMDKLIKGATVKGPEDAPLTMAWWNSFSCGFCGKFSRTVKQLEKKYDGKVKVAYKHFNRGPSDMFAAQVVECAGEQSKFWEMADTLFKVRGKGEPKGLAATVGIDGFKLEQCVKSGKYKAKINADGVAGRALNIRGTPGIIANKKQVAGAMPLAYFEKHFKEELN